MASPSLLWLAGMILGAASAQPYVELRATDPVVLDAVVSFKAVVHQEEDVDSGRKLVFKWSEFLLLPSLSPHQLCSVPSC